MGWLWINAEPTVGNDRGSVRVGPVDKVFAMTDRDVLETTLPALRGETLVALHATDRYVLVVTEKGDGLWRVALPELALTRVMTLERLDFEGGYDPGGMHHTGFADLAGGDVLVWCEWSLARLGPDGEVRWHTCPGEYLVSVDAVAADRVTVATVDACLAVDPATGAVTERRPDPAR